MSRKSTKTRPQQGTPIAVLRKDAGLSQYEVARYVGVPQPNSAVVETTWAWLKLSMFQWKIWGSNGTKKRGTGPTGKMRQLFEAASRLPRNQQQKLAAVLEAFVNQHATR